MSSRILNNKFFNRPTLKVAKELLGKILVRKIGQRKISGMITEVEAYVGPEDKASHASRGRTERTKIMFGKPGHWYVYLIYGMHYCLNIVTEKENYPAAILIRSVERVKGPGRVCRYFKIDKKFNARPANKITGLWIEDRGINPAPFAGSKNFARNAAYKRRGVKISPRLIKRGKRVGVDYAGKWKEKPWRFSIEL